MATPTETGLVRLDFGNGQIVELSPEKAMHLISSETVRREIRLIVQQLRGEYRARKEGES